MLHVVNESLGSSVVPACLKMGVITPILKKPSLCVNSLKNFRPISNLPFLGKVIEKGGCRSAVLSPVTSRHPWPHAYACSQPTGLGTARRRRCWWIQDDINRDLMLGSAVCLFSWISQRPLTPLTTPSGWSVWKLWLASEGLRWPGSGPISMTGHRVWSSTGSGQPLWISVLGFRRGRSLGPLLFLVYVIPLRSVIGRHPGVHHHGYADDRQLYTQFNLRDVDSYRHALQRLEMCVEEVRVWLLTNNLKINSDKTEFMVITTPHYQTTYRALQPAVSVGGIRVHAVSSLRNLGVIMDSTMDMHGQIQSVKCAMFHHLRTISNIRRYLDRDTCVKAVLSLVMCRVDYCNSLLVGQSAAAPRGLPAGPELRRPPGDGSAPTWPCHSSTASAALAADPPTSLLQTDVPPSQDPVHLWLTSLHELHGQPVYARQGTALCQCHYAPGCTSHPSGFVQTAASRCRLQLSGMRCLPTSITGQRSGLLKTNLKTHLFRQHFG